MCSNYSNYFHRAMMSTRRRRIKPVDDAMTYILSCTDKSGFMSRLVDSYKGRGVFAMQPIEPGDFALEYRGELLTQEECQSRPYSETESTFLFDFEWQNRHLCLDASKEDGSLGRLVNDNHKNPNCVMKKIIVNNKPHLCLFALKKIEIGSEIEYNYGDAKWPWRRKVTDPQTPAAAVETETSPAHQMLHGESKPDETQPQVTDPQTPAAAAVETETSPAHQMFHKESKPDETQPQVFTVQGFSLVDYSESDETDEDFMENQSPTPHRDVLRKITENTLMDSGPEVSNELYDSESVVNETSDEASPSNHSNEQSDNVLVPSLRRTKSLMWDRVQDFAGCLYDSDDDSTEGTSISKPERDSPRLRRSSCHPMSVYQENRGQKMRRACHPCKNVPPHHVSKARQRLQQMSVCQNNSGQKMRSACHPCKNVPPHHKSKKRVCLQEREVSKLLYSVGQQRRLLQ
ncbi:uncharacterized protein LOC117831136 isoform X3 [Notolabrus celidotus]|uniref:uncharacterized protein LOC117831136 isoform X3 n=1 Tax=Notolabrus celidotus TaxID=1203425 RepID=UPI0014904D67|nr:uncharacterized protein LOC117831136 isoform X3 [Notolabrus celidotus]